MLELLLFVLGVGLTGLVLLGLLLLPLALVGGGVTLAVGAVAGTLALVWRGLAWIIGGAVVLALGALALVVVGVVGGSLLLGLLVGLAPLWLPLLLVGVLLWAALRRPAVAAAA